MGIWMGSATSRTTLQTPWLELGLGGRAGARVGWPGLGLGWLGLGLGLATLTLTQNLTRILILTLILTLTLSSNLVGVEQ